MNSTSFLEPLLAQAGALTRRGPTPPELKNVEYGRAVARHLAQYDIGQTVVVAESACVAVEPWRAPTPPSSAPEKSCGTVRWAREPSTLSRALTVVKVAKPNQDMRFDVPVVGLETHRGHAAPDKGHLPGSRCRQMPAARRRKGITTAADAANIAIVAE